MNEMAHVLIEAAPVKIETIKEDGNKVFSLSERIQQERIQKQNSQPKSLRWLRKNKNILRFDLVIQREEVWDEERKSKLIESILLGYPVPPLYTLKSSDNQLWFLDGKQRGISLITYQEDEWELTDDIPPVFGVEVSGKKFSELPEEFKELIEEQSIDIYQLENLTVEQRDEVFARLNNGLGLKPFDVIRAVIGSNMLEYITELANRPFLSKYTNLSKNQRKNRVDQEIVLQIIGLVTGEIDDVTSNSLREYALQLRDKGLPEDHKELIERVFKYLDKAYERIESKQRQKVLRKNDIIALASIAEEMIIDNVDSNVFGEKSVEFLLKPTESYKATKSNGSAKKSNINNRVKIIYDEVKKRLA